MIILGIIILSVGFATNHTLLWAIGMAALLTGLLLMFMGWAGHPVRGRRHYF